MDAIVIALIITFGSTVGPLLVAYLNAKQRRIEKAEDYARQDAIAARLVAAEKRVAETVEVSDGKLDVIHTLVNSNLTTVLKSELDARILSLAMMEEVVALKKAAGHEPSPQALAAIKATQDKVAELGTALNEREQQNTLAEAQQKHQGKHQRKRQGK